MVGVRAPLIGLPGRRKSGGQIEGFPPSLHHLEIDIYLASYAQDVIDAGGLPLNLPLDVDPRRFIEHLDGLSEAAELMGAVNCVNRVDHQLIGDNTDGKGFVQSLREHVDPSEKRVVILGAGGAARAIAVELGLTAGVSEITVVNRSENRGQELVDLLNERVNVKSSLVHLHGDYEIDAEADVFINATSIGLNNASAKVPVDYESLRGELVVADVVFNPPRTSLLCEAESRGCTVVDGLGMLVNQGVIGFKIWSGVEPNAQVMREALEEYLEI